MQTSNYVSQTLTLTRTISPKERPCDSYTNILNLIAECWKCMYVVFYKQILQQFRNSSPFITDIVRKARRTRTVLIPEKFAIFGARVTYLREQQKRKNIKQRGNYSRFLEAFGMGL